MASHRRQLLLLLPEIVWLTKMPAPVTVFALDTWYALFSSYPAAIKKAADECSPHCKKAKESLKAEGVDWTELSVTSEPKWRQLMFLLTGGKTSVPQVFFGDEHIGGNDDLQALIASGKLHEALQNAGNSRHFPPEFRIPETKEYLSLIPLQLLEKWQSQLENEIDTQLGGSISSLLVMLSTPLQMVVLCTAGEGKSIYTVGAGGDKGHDGSEEKLYCQVVVERGETVFVDGIDNAPAGLKENEDFVKFGYGYYLGAVWKHDQMSGTAVAMEKKPGILKVEHIPVIEAFRDQIEADLAAQV